MNKHIKYLLDNQKWIIPLLAILLLSLFFAVRSGQPLLMGSETYHHLNSAQQISGKNFYYLPLNLALKFLPLNFLIIIPLILALTCLILFYRLAAKLGFEKGFTAAFLLLLIFTPTFINTFTTISAYSYFSFLVLLSLNLLQSKKWRFLGFIPLILGTFIDLFSILIFTGIFLIYIYINGRSKEKLQQKNNYLALIILSLMFFINGLIFKIPFVIGPFHQQSILPDLISDLGGLGGLSLFLLVFSLIGLGIAWKKKYYSFAYLFFPFILLGYILLSTQLIFYLTILLTIFSALGFVKVFAKKWKLERIKYFTILLFIFGLLFSTLSYLDRYTILPPTADAHNSLLALEKATVSGEVIFSDKINSEYIIYFAERPVAVTYQQGADISEKIYTANYIQDLFPILDENEISVLYLTPEMKNILPADYGLNSLLKNEKFKLIYSQGDYEVWVYNLG